jgi:hypothetical protein
VSNEFVEMVTDFHTRQKFPENEGVCSDAGVIPEYGTRGHEPAVAFPILPSHISQAFPEAYQSNFR